MKNCQNFVDLEGTLQLTKTKNLVVPRVFLVAQGNQVLIAVKPSAKIPPGRNVYSVLVTRLYFL